MSNNIEELKDEVKKIRINLIKDNVTTLGMKNWLISKEMQKNSIHLITYKWTEAYGKYEGNSFWSLKALQHYDNKSKRSEIIHEHIVPRKVIKDKLIERKESMDFDYLKDFFKNVLVGAIITKEEDKSLNNFSLRQKFPDLEHVEENPWARYKVHNQKVYEDNIDSNINMDELLDKLIIIFRIYNNLQEDKSKLQFLLEDQIIPEDIKDERLEKLKKLIEKRLINMEHLKGCIYLSVKPNDNMIENSSQN
jgi:hypothetical protein